MSDLVKRNETEILGLYLHIPFCVRKCSYCDFLSFPASGEIRHAYVDKLVQEIRECGKRPETAGRTVATVFLGGGTPSLLESEETERILDAVGTSFSVEKGAEITMEANPGAFDGKKARHWRKAGINRLSLGLQSACDAELERLGRIHTGRGFLESFHLAREAGFENMNVDLMSALPGQTTESFLRTLECAAELSPEHISAYSLIIEEGTPFYESYGAMEADLERYGEYEEIPLTRRARYKDLLPLPGEEADREMYHLTKAYLREQGYERYEISNYAKPGRECRHNIGYWNGTDYLGLGLGASSLLDGSRFSVTRSLETYLKLTPEDFRTGRQYIETSILSEKERMEEFMFLGLRLIRGVCPAEFAERFGCSMESVYGQALLKLREEGLLALSGEGERERIFLTEPGLDVSNYVLAKFLL